MKKQDIKNEGYLKRNTTKGKKEKARTKIKTDVDE